MPLTYAPLNPQPIDGGNPNAVTVAGTVTTATPTSGTSSITSVASSASSVQLLAANANRKAFSIFNDSSKTLYIKLGVTASNTSYTVQVAAGGFYEAPTEPIWTGEVDGIWSAANGNARITELS